MENTVLLSNKSVISEDYQQTSALMVRAGRKLIHELIEAQARMNPTSLALVSADRQLTYAELDRWAGHMAQQLLACGVGPECVVSIVLPRSAELVVAILAVLKSGGAFCPLEPSWPDVRLASLLEDVRPKCVITSSGMHDRAVFRRQRLLFMDNNDQHETVAYDGLRSSRKQIQPENLAYVLFTSGSTGKPKAVGVEHRNISNYVYSILASICPSPGSQFVLLTSASADLGYTMLFPSLCSGGALHVIAPDTAGSPELLKACFERRPPDYMKITPSFAGALLSSDVARNLIPRQCLVFGGEPLQWSLIDHIRNLSPDIRIMNHYGPTETTVGVLVNALAEANHAGTLTVSLGKPLANTQVHIFDENMMPLPEGHVGEIYIGGESVSRGYLERPNLTANQFVPDPTSSLPGARLYRTGDLALKSADGKIEFRSRADHQVKILGYRVELGEIESIIATHPAVRRVVVQRDGTEDSVTLVAYIESRNAPESDAEALRSWLKAQIPDHMVPGQFVFVAEMPCLASGKIDRQALKSAAANPPASSEASIFAGPVEERLHTLWCKVLRIKEVNSALKFFEAGGNSLRIIQLQSAIKREFGKTIPIPVLFAHPTIRAMAALLSDTPVETDNDSERVAENRRGALTAIRERRAAVKENV